MQPNTYPDGFPQNPLDAINFSYFLSDEEKADWRQWLESATAEQQFELVDTLHAMWMENQKSAIPNGFNAQNNANSQTAPQSDQSNTSGDDKPKTDENNTQAQPEPVAAPVQDEAPIVPPAPTPAPAPEPKTEPVKEEVKPAKTPQNNTTSIDNNQSAQQFGEQTYTPNPLIEEEAPQQPKPQKQEERKSQKNNQQSKKQKQPSDKQSSPQKDVQPSPHDKKSYFNVTKLRESATKIELEKLYTEYVSLRESSFERNHSFYEAQGKFLDKVMAVVINFEQVADFFDSLSQKIIDLNDKLVKQVKDYNSIKGSITSQHGDMKDQLDHLRNDVDRLYRTLREDKSDNRRQLEDIKTNIATMNADSYGSEDGLLQRIDLLSSRLHKLELMVNRGQGGSNGPIQPNQNGKTNISIG